MTETETKYFFEDNDSMVAPFVRPIGISATTASILVFLESVFLGALPILAYVATFAGPFIALAGNSWSYRKVQSATDAEDVFNPLFEEIHKNREAIQSSQTWAIMPGFQSTVLDQVRIGAKYRLLKGRIPAVEGFLKAMDLSSSSQPDARRAATRIINQAIHTVLGENGTWLALSVKNRDGGINRYEGDMWIIPILMKGRDPVEIFRNQKMEVVSLLIIDRNSNITGQLDFPKDEAKYRRFWDAVESEAKDDPDIKPLREALNSLPSLAEQAENQVLREIAKSRSIF